MSIKKYYLTAFFIFALMSVAFGQTEMTRTQYSIYGTEFLNYGQSLRVTAQNPRYSDSEIIPCIRVWIIFDVYEPIATGSTQLRLARRVSREALLDAGEAVTLDFPASRAGDYVSAAVFFRPAERELPEGARVRLAANAGVREAGRTILNLPAVEKGFDPQPDPPQFETSRGRTDRLPQSN